VTALLHPLSGDPQAHSFEHLYIVIAPGESLKEKFSERLDMIQQRIEENERQLHKLLDLYLNDDFPREMLQERKSSLEETIFNLRHEQAELSHHLQSSVLSDDQIEDIEIFCAQVREGQENATFEQKRQLIDMLDVRGKLAIENDEKVVYVKCILGQRLLSVARTSPWLSTHKGQPIQINIRLVIYPAPLISRSIRNRIGR